MSEVLGVNCFRTMSYVSPCSTQCNVKVTPLYGACTYSDFRVG